MCCGVPENVYDLVVVARERDLATVFADQSEITVSEGHPVEDEDGRYLRADGRIVFDDAIMMTAA